MRCIFVAHPVSGDVKGNLEKVAKICEEIYREGHLPIFPSHTWRAYFENDPAAALYAWQVNQEYFKRGMVDEMRFYGDRMSDGMRGEADLASNFDIELVGMTEATRAALEEMGLGSKPKSEGRGLPCDD